MLHVSGKGDIFFCGKADVASVQRSQAGEDSTAALGLQFNGGCWRSFVCADFDENPDLIHIALIAFDKQHDTAVDLTARAPIPSENIDDWCRRETAAILLTPHYTCIK
ncbi:hypothetical protein AOLI_G00066430 [Acnodon oligacanthus]